MAAFYNVIFVPMRSVFQSIHWDFQYTWYGLDATCDVVYIMDILVGARTGEIHAFLIEKDFED